MKSIPFSRRLLLLLMIINFNALAQNAADVSAKNTVAPTNNGQTALAEPKIASQANPTASPSGSDMPKTKDSEVLKNKPENCVPKAGGFIIYLISFSPLLVFWFVFSFVFIRLKKEGYKISDALKENEAITISTPNPLLAVAPAGSAPAPFVDETVQPKSSSRLIAFITSLITLGIATCFCTFWIFTYLKCGVAPNLDHVVNVILSLGLGVVPYAFNKISQAIK